MTTQTSIQTPSNTQTYATDTRQQRGLLISETMRIRQKGDQWVVPSQRVNGSTYMVNMRGQKPTCNCPDFEDHKEKCKHIFAVEYTVQRETTVWGPRIEEEEHPVDFLRAISPKQNWATYNLSQINEKERVMDLLRELCLGIPQPAQKRGRPRLPLGDVVFAATMKVFGTMSGRRASSDIRECHNKGQITANPHYNSIFKYLENPALTPILKGLIEESASPLKAIERDFAIDSSGFSSSVFDRWYEEKYGRIMGSRTWVKAHLMCGVTTNVITAVEVTGKEVADTTPFPQLLEATTMRFQIQEVSADKAYLSRKNLEAVSSIGATPFIAFKDNCKADNGCEIWHKMFHYFQFRKNEFLNHYHKRSNVESTFSMLKRKFGSSVRSKSRTAQINEVLCKVLCHNLCILVKATYEMNIQSAFWA